MKTQSMTAPAELIQAHEYYNHVLFNAPCPYENELNEALADQHLQKFKPQSKTILAVAFHNYAIAYPRFFKSLGEDAAQKWVKEFYTSRFSKSLIIHKQVQEFFEFILQNKKDTLENQPTWFDQLKEENTIYHLLYEDFSPSNNVIPPQHNTPLLSCQLVWQTPWRIQNHKLWFRNRATAFVENLPLTAEIFWQYLAMHPSDTLEQAFTFTFDNTQQYDSQSLLNAITPVLQHLLQQGVVVLSQKTL